MDLAALRRKQATLRIEFDGEFLVFTYNPHAYDDECQQIINQLATDPDNSKLAGVFEKLFVSWDLKDNGVEVPCTYDAFHQFLIPFLRSKIVNAIIEDELERGKLRSSDNTSNRPRNSALVPIGSTQSKTSDGPESQNGATT